MNKECEVEDCTRPAASRGWCRMHYARWTRHGDPTKVLRGGPREENRAVDEKRCANCEEVKPREEFYVSKKGFLSAYCKPCHSKIRRDKYEAEKRLAPPKPPRVRKPKRPCSFPGCKNQDKARGYCNSHNRQRDAGEEMKPLHNYRPSYINDDLRRCTACQVVKSQEEFYDRTQGGKQSNCKECQYLIARFSATFRQQRYTEALELVTSMPRSIQNKYLERLSQHIKINGLERSNDNTKEKQNG